MAAITRWMRRLLMVVRGRSVEQAMDDELRYHIDCEAAERIKAGEPPAAARFAALRDFGGLEYVKEEARDARGTRRAEDFLGDLRNAARVLRRNPGVTTAAVLTFALGIGAAGAIFCVVYGVLMRPLPYKDPGGWWRCGNATSRGTRIGTWCRSRTSKRGATGIRCSTVWPRSCPVR
jgi:putative ABC transport system permease protein